MKQVFSLSVSFQIFLRMNSLQNCIKCPEKFLHQKNFEKIEKIEKN